MAKQHTNPKVIVAAATGYSGEPWGVTFYGPMGHITLNDDGTFITGGWASCTDSGGYTDPPAFLRVSSRRTGPTRP